MTDEISPDDAPRDLLGDPIDQIRESWGRPGFQINKKIQDLVTALAGAGWSQQRIARHLGCDPKTLRKTFSRELAGAVDQVEAEAIMAIHKRMKEGNVSAANRVLTMAEKGRAVPTAPGKAAASASDDDGPQAKEPPKGKKEQLAEAAQQPVGRWGRILQ